jgi:hypothetical protein
MIKCVLYKYKYLLLLQTLVISIQESELVSQT